MSDRTDQSGSHLESGAVQAGRDVKLTENNYHYGEYRRGLNNLKSLIAKLDLKAEAQHGVVEFIEQLRDYVEPPESLSGKDLETKLKEAGRNIDDITKATLHKERFRQLLTELQFYPKAQHILAEMLGLIEQSWRYKVMPLFESNADRVEIDRAIYDEVLVQFQDVIGVEPLSLTTQQVEGMMFFLTGNCWINWE
jgi:hypothetical protein